VNILNEARLVEMFLESLISERGLSKNTVRAYLNDLEHFLIFYNHNKLSILNLDESDLVEYFALEGFRKLKASSLARKISSVKQLYIFLQSEGLVKNNPSLELEMPKKPKHLPKSISKDAIKKLLDHLEEDKSIEGIRNYCLLQILYSTGMRVGELVGLREGDLRNPIERRKDHKIFVIKGKGAKERVVIFDKAADKALREYIKVRDALGSDYLFPSKKKNGAITHLSRQMFFIILKKASLKCNLDPDSVSPHKIRHSFASHLLQNGADMRVVQELMGHADISSTQIYTKVLSKQAIDLVSNAHPLAAK